MRNALRHLVEGAVLTVLAGYLLAAVAVVVIMIVSAITGVP